MRIKHDQQARAAYIYLDKSLEFSRTVGFPYGKERVLLDLSADDQVIGVEVLFVDSVAVE